jgi:hypothetical protein
LVWLKFVSIQQVTVPKKFPISFFFCVSDGN